MAQLPLVQARLAGFYVESVLIGIYLVTMFYTVQALITKGKRRIDLRGANRPMLAVVTLMFINICLATMTSCAIIWYAFVLAPPGTSAEQRFKQITYWPIILKSAVLLTQTTIGDGMLIYRCWIMYKKSFRPVAFSIVLWLGGTACTIATVYIECTFDQQAVASTSKMFPFSVSFWASTVTLNILTTTLLVLPIWRAARNLDNFGYRASGHPNRLKAIMQVVIESGLLYTTTAFVTFVTYTSKSNSLYIASNALVPITGIAFNLIVIRTSKAANTDVTTTTSGSLSTWEGNTRQPVALRHIMGDNTINNAGAKLTSEGPVRILVSRDIVQDKFSNQGTET